MRRAMQLWSDRTNINFKEISGNQPDIWVKFVTKDRIGQYSFDGPGGSIAHAFHPNYNTDNNLSGDINFDDDEEYTYGSAKGRNFLWIATHEVGKYNFTLFYKQQYNVSSM